MPDIQMNTASSTVSSAPPPKPVEPMLFKLYVGEWAKNQKKTDDKMKSLEDINTKLNVLNSLLAKLGKLLTQVTASGDNKKLKEVLDKEAGLLEEINKQIKEADLPEPPFPNSDGLKKDSHMGKDVNAALEIVKAQISNLSNRLQSATSAVNQSMQVTTAIMSAITDMTQKMFDAKSKALS